MKKIIGFLLTLAILLSAVPVMSVGASEYEDIYQLPFTDLNYDAWYMEGINFCYGMDFVNGMSATKFEPNGTLTRAQFVQILAQLDDGYDPSDYEGEQSGFEDVKPSHWYNEAVNWAVTWGYVKGLSPTRFGPNEPITREQLARLLYLFGESDHMNDEYDMSVRDDLSAYADADKVSDWALEGMQWAVAAGIISGMNETTLAPRATATRAQVCRMIMSYWEFMLYGVKDTSGAFAAMAEYIKSNGEYDPEAGEYNIFNEVDGETLVAGYVESEEVLMFGYFTEPYDVELEGESFPFYRETTILMMNGLEEMYSTVYVYGELMNADTHAVVYEGMLTESGFTEVIWECLGYEEAEYRPRAEAAVGKVIALLEETLSHTEYTMEDIFKADPNNNRSGAFKVIADYTVANATDSEYGCYYYEIIEDGRFYTLEYDLTMQTICIYYGAYEELQFGGYEKTEYAYLYFDSLASEYEYIFDYWFNESDTLFYSLVGLLGNGTFTEITEDSNNEDQADIDMVKALEAESRIAIIDFIDRILSENGLTREDFFITK